MNKFSKIIIVLVGAILFTVFIYFLYHIADNQMTSVPLLIMAGIFLYILILSILFLFINTDYKTSSNEVSDYYAALRQSLIINNYQLTKSESKESGTQAATDILELMSINMAEIKEYYVLSKNMAKSSFKLSVSMCLLGFTLITSSIIFIFAMDITIGSAIIPAIGGVIVEVVAGTSLFVYRQSLEQLNKYYEALHENERFLSVVNITDKISPEKKDDVYQEIIKSQLNYKDMIS
ncbi:hypothetical protein Ana3638_24455 [Anaerocolumna sedimenticola]|uniref:Cyanobacterial TRADD-N associated 2 transmembrane domain-containing protein n=1 Tax=Anaerocolumna sedimenticola TaxID=2696063 RepID=A0A6P1TTD2_9FIRM|nr:hypothetical protein [Anaerocolumna sedimenticola]QHQ63542.1 hypothetical protein Ana3638_24455 [Anaerocolumna sedimenticola]